MTELTTKVVITVYALRIDLRATGYERHFLNKIYGSSDEAWEELRDILDDPCIKFSDVKKEKIGNGIQLKYIDKNNRSVTAYYTVVKQTVEIDVNNIEMNYIF